MIFVTLGTQDKPFTRLLEAVQKQIDNGNIKDKVIVQSGYTKFTSNDMEIFDYVSMEKFNEYLKKCDLLITHGGVGNILSALKLNKKIIAAARLAKYGEHTNDHQLQIVNKFSEEGYILKLDDFNNLDKILIKAKDFKPKRYISNTENFCKHLKEEIDKLG